MHNSPPAVRIMSQLNPLHTPPTSLPKVHFEPILPSTPWSFSWSFSFGLSRQNPVHVSHLSHACYMPCPPHSPTAHKCTRAQRQNDSGSMIYFKLLLENYISRTMRKILLKTFLLKDVSKQRIKIKIIIYISFNYESC
jgi:hypothetical protein